MEMIHVDQLIIKVQNLALVLSQVEPCSFGLTPSPKVDGVRSWSSQRPLRSMLTDRPFAHRRMQVSSPSCGKRNKRSKSHETSPVYLH